EAAELPVRAEADDVVANAAGRGVEAAAGRHKEGAGEERMIQAADVEMKILDLAGPAGPQAHLDAGAHGIAALGIAEARGARGEGAAGRNGEVGALSRI